MWFDENRAGISQQGEVRKVAELPITRLFYTPDRADEHGHVYASRGYERVRNGTHEIRPSMDWFAEGEAHRSTLVTKLITESILSSHQEVDGPATLIGHQPTQPYKPSQVPSRSGVNVSGGWEWHMDDHEASLKGLEPRGTLTLAEDSAGAIRGHSYLGTPLRAEQGAQSAVSVAGLQGTHQR